VDTVGPWKKYQEKLQSFFPSINSIVVAEKADAKYPIVSAASIVAKVIRDDILDNWDFKHFFKDKNFGCGYTSDKITISWLNDNCDKVFGFPSSLVRFSWSTCENILSEKAYKVFWNDEENEGKRKIGNIKSSSFFGKKRYFNCINKISAFD
jgi:ribonuclease H2 subunit A